MRHGRGYGCGGGEGEERVQTEWTPHPVSAGCGHRVPAGVLPPDQAPYRAGQSPALFQNTCDPQTCLPS